MDAMLKVEGINVYYGAIHAIKDVSFQVNEGEVVTLIGANGAGKSTILKTIAGLLTSHTGSIEVPGPAPGGTPAHKIITKGLALVRREPDLPPDVCGGKPGDGSLHPPLF